ncbi:MAG: hypothetical protein ACK57K_03560, partial [Chryseotalea sp.]
MKKVKDIPFQKTFTFYALVISVIFFAFTYFVFVSNSLSGTDGDKYGILNALFSGLAFAGLLATLHLQKRELELQRLELEHTREELAKHTNAFALQRFETTFYNLLNSNRILIESITIDERVEIKGYKAFEKFYAEFK